MLGEGLLFWLSSVCRWGCILDAPIERPRRANESGFISDIVVAETKKSHPTALWAGDVMLYSPGITQWLAM